LYDTEIFMQKHWEDLERIQQQYERISLKNSLNYDLYNQITIIHHSSSIEGSTLTLEDTELLITENLKPKNKPQVEINMVSDHYQAILFIVDEAKKKTKITPQFIQEIAKRVMTNTGGVINQMGGSYQTNNGDFRLGTVITGTVTYMDYKKVSIKVKELCDYIQSKIEKCTDAKDIHALAFEAHFNLVALIHPFGNGNERTSRLLMNYIQLYHNQPLSIIFKEDKAEYIQVLRETRNTGDITVFHKFMIQQHIKFLQNQIDSFQNGAKDDLILGK
jgi:Fic family protein